MAGMQSVWLVAFLLATVRGQSVENVQCQLDFLFIIDGSASVCGNNPSDGNACDAWIHVINFMEGIINDFNIGDDNVQVATIVFADSATVMWDLERFNNKSSLLEAVSILDYPDGGGTNIQLALNVARTDIFTRSRGDRFDADNIVILITDGRSTVDSEMTIPAADRLRLESSVKIYVVGVGGDLNIDELRGISSPPRIENQNFHVITSFAALGTLQDDLVKRSCQDTTNCDRLDIVFIVDGSESICDGSLTNETGIPTCENWYFITEFIKKLTSKFHVGTGADRVAMVIFADNGVLVWDLQKYVTADELESVILSLTYPDGARNTSGGLAVAREGVFINGGGDRPNIPNLAIVITTGQANRDTELTIPNAERLKEERDTLVFVIGVTSDVDESDIRDISSPPQEENINYYITSRFRGMSDLVEDVAGNICSLAPAPSVDCAQEVDVVFVIDGSRTIRDNVGMSEQDNWVDIMNFILIGMSRWPGGVDAIGPSGVQIGIAVFSEDATIEMEFGEHDNYDDFAAAIMKIPFPGGDVKNTVAGLRLGKEMLSDSKNRQKVPDVVIMISDGSPNINENQLEDAVQDLQDVAQVFVLGVTIEANEEFVRDVASPPKKINRQYWLSVDYDSLESFMESVETGVWDYLCGGVIPESEGQSDCEVDLAFLVDSSGSIRKANPADGSYDNWSAVKTSLVKFTEELNKKTMSGKHHRFAMVRFSTQAHLDWNLEAYINNQTGLENAINALHYDDHLTNTSGALKVTREQVFKAINGDRPGVPNYAVIFTDGKPQMKKNVYNVDETVEEAEKLRNDSTNVMALGVTDKDIDDPISKETLKRMSSPPQKQNSEYYMTSGFRSIEAAVESMVGTICNKDVCKVDVVIILDYSGSIRKERFIKTREFIADLILETDVGESTRVGVVTFSDESSSMFHLNQLTTREEAVDAVNGIAWRRGRTNTASALRYARTDMFTETNGDREDVINVAVVVTDGGSNMPNKQKVLVEAHLLKQDGVHVITVGVGTNLDLYELYAIASYPYSVNTVILPDIRNLQKGIDSVISLICNSTDECKNVSCENGGTCLDGMGVYWCLCPDGFVGPRCETGCKEKADVVFAMDYSGSVGKINTQKEVDFVSDLILHGINLNNDFHRVGALHYSTNVHLGFNLNKFKTKFDVLSGLGLYYNGGTTSTSEAINVLSEEMFTRENGARGDVTGIGVIITDGRSDDPQLTWQNAMEAREGGIHLITLGIGDKVRQLELEGIVSSPVQGNIFSVEDFDSFDDVREKVTDSICNNVDECASNPCRNGGSCEDLRGGYACKCGEGFTGNRCLRECSGELDLVIVLDSSRGMRSQRFLLVLQFIGDVVKELSIGSDLTRVGMISYSDNIIEEFHLDRYTGSDDVISHIRRIQYQGEKANIAQALTVMIETMFSSGNGGRDDVKDMALIITNANSNVDQEDTIPEAIRAKVKGIHMVVVGVGDVDWVELRGLASYPQTDTVFHSKSQDNLPDLVQDVVDATCDDHNECESDPCENGAECRDERHHYYCQCTSAYVGQNCHLRCSEEMDIVFVLDLSGSVDTVYHVITNFTRRMLLGLPMQQQRTQVGIITYSTEARVHAYLNQYQDKQDMLNTLTFNTAGGRTNTQSALNLLRTDVFRGVKGDRSGVRNIAVVVTDGRANVLHQNTPVEAEAAREDDIQVYVVAVGDEADMDEAEDMATNPDSSHVFQLPNVDKVNVIADDLLQELCD